MDEYGPQTAEINAILEDVWDMTLQQAEKLVYDCGPSWDAAYDDAQSVVRQDLWRDLQKTISEISWGVVRYAVRDAVLALLVEDLISDEYFNILYGPWKSVMEK